MQAVTFETLLGLLAVMVRIGEAMWLDRDDIDWDQKVLVVRSSKFGRSREVVCTIGARLLIVITLASSGVPQSAVGLGRAAGCGELLKPVVDPAPAHTGRRHQFPHCDPVIGSEGQRGPQDGLGWVVRLHLVLCVPRAVSLT